jgi:hypothetical protein
VTALAKDHHVSLGRTGWTLWRDAALRGAGFPAVRFLDLCDDELPAAADLLDDAVPATRDRYATVFAAAAERLSATIRRTAAEGTFREAVTWQNPGLVRNCLDKAAAGEARNVHGRYHELVIATYLQRYCLKNDTIGFFGPVGWARIGPEDAGLSTRYGPELLARRTTYFERWAIDAIADMVAARPDVWPWLRPSVVPSATLEGWVIRQPFRRPATLNADEMRVIAQCDGRHSVRYIAGDPPDPRTVSTLLRLRELGVVRIDLSGHADMWPERELAVRLEGITDVAVRSRAKAPLDELVRARDAVSAAAGQPDQLARTGRVLAETFERITGSAATRRPGGTYAGRTLVYEDAVRDVDVRIGRRVIDRLAAPLGLVLDSAAWLTNRVGDQYDALARRLLDRELERTGEREMPLLRLLTAVMPEFGQIDARGVRSDIADAAVAEFQQRWRRVVGLQPDAVGRTRHHMVTVDAIADRAAREFATGPPRWSGARWYSPDVMVAGDDAHAVARGDLDFVLGELHCASNTLETRLFVAQHPAPERLRAAATASRLDERVILIPRWDSPQATSRMSRATELMLPSYAYVCLGEESVAPPVGATVFSAADLVVRRRGDDLVVRRRGGGAERRFLEVAGDPLSALVADGFQPFGGTRHRPRVTIDRLVVSREAWTFAATEVAWAFVGDERQRYAKARRWRAEHGLPERGFFRVPVDRKPMAVDFRSLPLVNLLGKSIRRTAEAGCGDVTLTEMLPDVDRLWLRDGRGAFYTAEFRLVAVAGCAPEAG